MSNVTDEKNATKFCKYCGEKIAMDAVVCPKCGRQVEMLAHQDIPVIINNSASSSASAVSNIPRKTKKHYSLLLDILLTCFTGGLWLIWVLVRPKYE